MADITAAMVKALRDETQQGMMDCKKALEEAGGAMEAAKDLLRKKGLATAEKKAARTTSEGLVAVKVSDDGRSAAMVEVQCETDFCARNEVFQKMVSDVAEAALAGEDGDVPAGEAITAAVQDAFAKIGENMSYARGVRLTAPKLGTYVHHNSKVGVLVAVEGEVDDETLSGVCMHIAFSDPMALRPEDIPEDVVAKEKAFATQEAIDSGKPPEIAEKIVTGKMRKFLAANALLEQPYVRDDKQSVQQVLGDATITKFVRFAVGQ